MGDMTVDELKDKKLWFLWSAKPGRNGKVTKVPLELYIGDITNRYGTFTGNTINSLPICHSAKSSCQRAFRQENNPKCENIRCKAVSYQATTGRW